MKPQPLDLLGDENNRLAADLWGDSGHPVILLHGGGQTRHAWQATGRRLAAAGMRAITVDMRGHGDSDWVKSGDYTFSAFGRDASAIALQIAERYGELPSGVGASLGGLSFLIVAERETRHLLDALILVDIVPRMNPDGVARITGFMRERMDDGFASLEEAADAIAAYLPHRKRPTSFDGLRKNLRLGDDGRYRWHWDPAFASGDRSVMLDARPEMEKLDAALGGISLPVLLVRGMQSELVGADVARETVDRLRDGRFVDVGGAGHMVAGDRNDVFCAAILDFLAERRAA